MNKNGVKNDRQILNFPLFYLVHEDIQRGKIQNNIIFFNAEFLHSQDKRDRISKQFLLLQFIFFGQMFGIFVELALNSFFRLIPGRYPKNPISAGYNLSNFE